MGYIFDALNRADAGKGPGTPPAGKPLAHAAPPPADSLPKPAPRTPPVALSSTTPVVAGPDAAPASSLPEPTAAAPAPKAVEPGAAPDLTPSVSGSSNEAVAAEPTPEPVAPLQTPDLALTFSLPREHPAAAAPAPAAPRLRVSPEGPRAIPARPTGPSPAERRKFDDRVVALLQPSSPMAEEYRAIRTGLLARWQNKRHLVHLITSATPQEGKTITSLNLGLSFAELRNRKTVVVEADLRLPQFSALLGLDGGPGVVDVLEGQADLAEALRPVPGTDLVVMPAGRRAHDQAVQLLSSPAAISLLKLLRQRYDHVIVDTPPVVHLADAGILGALSDDVLLIVRLAHTPRTLVEQAIHTLARYNAPVVGLIATDQKRRRGRYYYKYGYHYHYCHSNPQAQAA